MFLFLPEILIAVQPRPVDLPLKSPFEDERKKNDDSKDLKIEGIEKNEAENIQIDIEETIKFKTAFVGSLPNLPRFPEI